jgi:hypothetical protein
MNLLPHLMVIALGLAGCGELLLVPESTHTSTSTNTGGAPSLPPFASLCTGSEHWTALGEANVAFGGVPWAWTGAELFVFGLDQAYRADPLQSTWAFLGPTPTGGHYQGVAAWAGGRVVLWGGRQSSSYDTPLNQEGAMLDPETLAATPTPLPHAPPSRQMVSAVSTGSEVIVWGGTTGAGDGNFVSSGAVLDVVAQSWTPTKPTTLAPRAQHVALWTGARMIIWGGLGNDPDGGLGDGALYDPATNTWTPMAPSPLGRRFGAGAVWTGSRMLIWGGFGTIDGGYKGDGASYDPATDTWQTLSTLGAPAPRSDFIALWTGSKMLVVGGRVDTAAGPLAASYDLAIDTWTPLPTEGAPFAADPAFQPYASVWLGCAALYWGQNSTSSEPIGWLYEPPS